MHRFSIEQKEILMGERTGIVNEFGKKKYSYEQNNKK
jgi:hypothetical protein